MSTKIGSKLALVTGAGSGIGRAVSQIFAKNNILLIIADKKFKSTSETLKLIEKNDHLPLELDVSDLKSVENGLNLILNKYNQPPNIIVNCAGITRDNFLINLSEEDFDEVIKVNLKGTFNIMKIFSNAIIKHDKFSSSCFVNLASISGKIANIGQTNYNASKVGVEAMTKTAAKELGKYNIRFNSVLPGFTKTPMTAKVPENIQKEILKYVPLRRMAEPNEIAEVIHFLASDKASYINGASIEVSGGLF